MSFKLRLLHLGFTCSTAADKLRFILSESQCLRESNRGFLFFFFFVCGFFYFRMRGNLLIYRKMHISRLLWGDRWKLHGEIQCHAIMTTYMFMTNDQCEDSFVQISRIKHVFSDMQVYQCTFRGLRIAQIPMKEGAALGIWMICTRFEVYVCSYVEQFSMRVDQFFLKDDDQR